MPTRTFNHFDMSGVAQGYTVGPTGTITPVVVVPRFGEISIIGSGTFVGNGTCTSTFNYQQTGNIDFSSFPGIPTNDLITKIVISYPYALSTTAAAGAMGGNTENITIQLVNVVLISNSQNAVGAISFSDSKSGTLTSTNDFAPAISYATLVSTYSAQQITLSSSSSVGGWGGGSFDYSLSVGAGWQLEVTYEEFPYHWTLNTTSVTIGEDITITSTDGGLDKIILDKGDDDDGDTDITVTDGVTKVKIKTTDIKSRTPDELVFTLPVGILFSGGGIGIDITLEDPDITYRVGTLTVLNYGDVSGIYKLVIGKTSDTIYNNARDGTTTEVKIPNPFARIGFIGGE